MSSDLSLLPIDAIQLYCARVSIESMFHALKNTFGAFTYHFWSKYLQPSSRRPRKNQTFVASSSKPLLTFLTFQAMEKFVNLQLLTLGLCQLLSIEVFADSNLSKRCWLRTPSKIPSEFVTRHALIQSLNSILYGLPNHWISRVIRQKREKQKIPSAAKIKLDF